MIKYSINNENIFWVEFSGDLTLELINNFLEELKNLDTLPENLKALYDLRKANFKFGIDEVGKIAKAINSVTLKFKSIRAAFIVNNPDSTAVSIVFNQENKNSNTNRELFSTIEAAVEWLLY